MKHSNTYALLATAVIGLAAAPALAVVEKPDQPQATTQTAMVAPADSNAPDNSQTNKNDANNAQPTADKASNEKSDVKVMGDIRTAVVNDKSLSTYAHNVKIISVNGKVSLKGPVKSQDESNAIEAKAKEIAGEGNVTNELKIKN